MQEVRLALRWQPDAMPSGTDVPTNQTT